MNRLMWKTFYTDPRFVDGQLVPQHHGAEDEHEHEEHGTHTDVSHEEAEQGVAAHDSHAHGGHVHPSPPSMMWPLYILAFLSIVAGAALGPWSGIFHHFLAPSVAGLEEIGMMRERPELFNQYIGYGISSAVAIAGLILARVLYTQHMQTGDLIPAERKVEIERSPLHPYTFLLNKWWWDSLYNTIFIKYGGWLADRILWRKIDAEYIDGLVNGAGQAVGGLSGLTRRVQTGYVRNYALGMLLGVVILVLSLLLTWNKLAYH